MLFSESKTTFGWYLGWKEKLFDPVFAFSVELGVGVLLLGFNFFLHFLLTTFFVAQNATVFLLSACSWASSS